VNGHGGRRDGAGRKPGVPNKTAAELREIARRFGADAIERLAEIGGLIRGKPADSEAVRVAALKELLDRGYGRAPQVVGSDGEKPLLIRFEWDDPEPVGPVINGSAPQSRIIAGIEFDSEESC
jgi:hypothetical protein